MPKKYTPDWWDFDSMFDATRYAIIARCVDFVEEQVSQFDERNETDFSEDFAPLIQEAFLLILVAQLEHHLKKVCDVIAELRNIKVRSADLKGANGFESCISYSKKVLQIPIPVKNLDQIRSIVKIRNALVHQGGYIDELPKDLGQLDREVKQGSDGRLDFSGAFVEGASTACKALVLKVEEAARSQNEPWSRGKKHRRKQPGP